MLKITVSCKPNGNRTAKVVGADVAFVVAAYNRTWWGERNRINGAPLTYAQLIQAVLDLPLELGATVTFSHS